jgi:hypothetical protein
MGELVVAAGVALGVFLFYVTVFLLLPFAIALYVAALFPLVGKRVDGWPLALRRWLGGRPPRER